MRILMVITINIGLILIGIACLTIVALAVFRFGEVMGLIREAIEMSSRNHLMTYDFEKGRDMLDKLIAESGTRYRIENFEYKPMEEQYMTKEQIKLMAEFMQKDVLHNITPEFEEVLGLYVNIESEEDLMKFIFSRIELYIMNYAIEVNQDLKQ